MRLRLLILLTACGLAAPAAAQPFAVRGALPWHNFLSGPTAWNEDDWRRYLDWMQKRGLNLLALHCYTGGAQRYVNYVEPMIRIEYRNVVPEAFFDTSLTARWGYRPLAVKDFAFGTGKLFAGAPAFGAQAALAARDNEDRYRRAQALIRRVFEMAHARGIQVGMGFEFGVYPPELFSVIPPDSYLRGSMLPDPTHPASREILRIAIDDILRAYPGIDWVWLWLQEHEAPTADARLSPALQEAVAADAAHFAGAAGNTAFTGVWALAYIREARAYLASRAPKVRMAISGWGGDNQLTGILAGLDKGLPRDIVFTCLNPSQGLSPQPAVLAEIAKHREVWAIPWLEGDAKLWHPQPRVGLLRDQLQLARRQGLQGAVAIHWRTGDIRDNMDAFAEFAANPDRAPAVEEFYLKHATEQYGPSAAGVAPLLARMDRERWFESLLSPEYFPYDPSWGRLTPELQTRLRDAADTVAKLSAVAQGPFRDNLNWLGGTLRFALLLHDTGAALEPAYRLKERSMTVPAKPAEFEEARKTLAAAPIEALFRTYAARVRSRGELGVLSSLNQRVWLQFRELQSFAQGSADPAGPKRLSQHKVMRSASPLPDPAAQHELIPSLVEGVKTPDDWYKKRRPELMALWTRVLGKLDPTPEDSRWFGDIRKAQVLEKQDKGKYTRLRLDLPMESDFQQPHLLLMPKNQGPGPFPAVICWTSTTPDYTVPEQWWGEWLAGHGYVVLTGWSFIRNYRDGTTYSNGVAEKLYDRFGHWLPMAKMVHDVRREAEYLRSLPQVNGQRIGFMGFSLSAKPAVYVGAFAPEIHATVALDPHIAINGGTNWVEPWYLDVNRPFLDIPTPQHTVLSLLNSDPARPGLEHDHHEVLALAAPRPFLLIGGCRQCEDNGGDSDDRQSWGYFNRAREVYSLLGIPERLQFVLTGDGHHANGPEIDPAWQRFFERWLKQP